MWLITKFANLIDTLLFLLIAFCCMSHTHMHTHKHTHTRTHVHTRTHIDMHAHTDIHAYIDMYTHAHINM